MICLSKYLNYQDSYPGDQRTKMRWAGTGLLQTHKQHPLHPNTCNTGLKQHILHPYAFKLKNSKTRKKINISLKAIAPTEVVKFLSHNRTFGVKYIFLYKLLRLFRAVISLYLVASIITVVFSIFISFTRDLPCPLLQGRAFHPVCPFLDAQHLLS